MHLYSEVSSTVLNSAYSQVTNRNSPSLYLTSAMKSLRGLRQPQDWTSRCLDYCNALCVWGCLWKRQGSCSLCVMRLQDRCARGGGWGWRQIGPIVLLPFCKSHAGSPQVSVLNSVLTFKNLNNILGPGYVKDSLLGYRSLHVLHCAGEARLLVVPSGKEATLSKEHPTQGLLGGGPLPLEFPPL